MADKFITLGNLSEYSSATDEKIRNFVNDIDTNITELKEDYNESGINNTRIKVDFPANLSGTKYGYTTDILLTAGEKYIIKNSYTKRLSVFVDGYTDVSVDIQAGGEGIFIPNNSGYLRVYTSYAVAGKTAYLILYGDIRLLKEDWNTSKSGFDSLASRFDGIDEKILKSVSGNQQLFYNATTVEGYTDFNTLPFNKIFVYTSSISGLKNTPTGSFFNGVVLTLSITPDKTYGVQISVGQNTGDMHYRYLRTDSGGNWVKVKKDTGDSETAYYVGYGKTDENYYDTFTACIRAIKDNESRKVIYINGGTYDIYTEMGGANFVSSLTGSENWYDVCDIIPPNTRIIGKGNVIFEMKLPDTVSDAVAKLLSPVNIRGTCEMENIKIFARNCRYCIHDETSGDSRFSGAAKTYKNIICEKINGANLGYPQAYAAGFDDDMKFTFDNCVFKSYGEVWSAHNRSSLINNSSHITINNSVFTSSNNTSRAIRFGNMNKTKEQIKVVICNSYLSSNVLVRDEYTTEGLINAFDITMLGCGSKTCEISTQNNDYEPIIYQIN